MTETRRVIITGGPGTGKSTLIDLLQKRNFPCHSEVSRAVIKRQLELGSRLLPWDDLTAFSHLVFSGQLEQYKNAVAGEWNFYDRGMPDVLAYLRKMNIYEQSLEEGVKAYPYHPCVFLTPPWPEIYSVDNERRENLKEMEAIHENLVQVYTDLNYEVVEMPRIDPEERIHLILHKLGILEEQNS